MEQVLGITVRMEDEESDKDEMLSFASSALHNFSNRALTIEDCEMLGLVNISTNEYHSPHLYNITCLGHAPTLTRSQLTKAIILSVMAVFSLVGNIWTMISIRKQNRHRSGHVYTIIYHLSIADLCVTFWCILGEAFWYFTVEWKLGNVECKIFKFAQMFSLYLSTFIMVLIAVDRFISVKYPLKSMSRGMCVRLIAACWSFSAILSLPQTVIFHVSKGPFQETFYQCVTHGFYTQDWQEQLYATFTLIFMFILPLIILCVTYLKTIVTLHRNEEFVDHSGSCRTLIDPNRRKLIRRAKMKSLRISVAITVTFLCCWTPYYVMMIVAVYIGGHAHEDLQSAIFFFGMSNSVFNPLIYGIFHLYRPRRKDLIRGNSSKKTLLTNLSLHGHRSATLQSNGSMVTMDLHSHSIIRENGKTKNSSPKSKLAQWQNGSIAITEGHTVM